MMMNFIFLGIPCAPFLACLLLLFFGRKLQAKFGEAPVETVGISFTVIAFVFSASLWVASLGNTGFVYTLKLSHWFTVGHISLDWALRLSPMLLVMSLIITGIGSLILLYASFYMHKDRSFWRFYLYMNLFITAMLLFVLADNLLVAFVGWEGIGVCSYLLISFWFHEEENATSGRKAFTVNRLGDLGFLAGILLLISSLPNTMMIDLRFASIAKQAYMLQHQMIYGVPLLEVIAFCFMIAAIGKSAQLPLFIWLPDAMAGPTPVSALIHAATMVTAGICLIIRLFPLFLYAPTTLLILSIIAGTSCLYAALVACFQWDIKRVLAYSTMSQLSYMFLALSIGGLKEGFFHLVTHAAFKALLFMGAGSIIVSLHHEQDMRNMGGLFKKMPFIAVTFIMGTLAITGFPFTAGYFSKDAILEKAWETGHYGVWVVGFIGAGLTAFYMWRAVFLTFFAKPAKERHVESISYRMKIPMFILAFLALFIGWINDSHHLFNQYVDADIPDALFLHKGVAESTFNMAYLNIITVAWGVLAFILAFALYAQWRPAKANDLAAHTGNKKGLWLTLARFRSLGYNMERFVAQTIPYVGIQIVYAVAKVTALFDFYLLRNTFDEVANTTLLTSEGLQKAQSGNVKTLALCAVTLLCGVVLISILFL